MHMRFLPILAVLCGTMVAAAASCAREPSLVDIDLAVHLQYLDTAPPSSSLHAAQCEREGTRIPTTLRVVATPAPTITDAPNTAPERKSTSKRVYFRARRHDASTVSYWMLYWERVAGLLWRHRHVLREGIFVM
ncbi:hypothetical protein C2E23DRAFT_886523 [Lenzites betulinus]|nr:hypothetical protein C2E23DRAFT_886523 [Lenzites betulinus]